MAEYAPELVDGLLDGGDGVAPHADVAVGCWLGLFHHEELLVGGLAAAAAARHGGSGRRV